jgi:hypothetical protein
MNSDGKEQAMEIGPTSGIGQIVAHCTRRPAAEEALERLEPVADLAIDVGMAAARTNRVVDTVVRLGKVAYPGLRPHLVAAIDDNDTIIDDLVVAFLDQVLGYDVVHTGVGIASPAQSHQ